MTDKKQDLKVLERQDLNPESTFGNICVNLESVIDEIEHVIGNIYSKLDKVDRVENRTAADNSGNDGTVVGILNRHIAELTNQRQQLSDIRDKLENLVG